MQACILSRSNSSCDSVRSRSYETTYQREFALKKLSPIVEGVPLSQQFLIGCPYQLSDSVGASLYTMDFDNKKNLQQRPFFRPDTSRANRPHPHREFPYWPRAESLSELPSNETKQALRNQLNSTYQVDYTGAAQGFQIPLAYERSLPYWRHRAQHTLDSEYRNNYRIPPKAALHFGGRYSFSCRDPADAIVPQTLPLWRTRSLQSIYGQEISGKPPTEFYMKELVDSLNGPMN